MTFDRIVVVDWSANAAPKRGADSIWVATVDVGVGVVEPVNVPTRRLATEILIELCARPGRVLVGFDFPLGYPAGFAVAAGLCGTPWTSTWEHLAAAIDDDHRNRNNRWTVAADLNQRLGAQWFWGAPPGRAGEWLASTKPTPPPDEVPVFRHAERRLREQGLHPFSTSQLLGAGSVGSQTLTGIPVVHRLRHHPDLERRAAVWPFETGLAADPLHGRADGVVLAEVWPSAIPFDHVDHPVKDARQVVALATHLAALDADGHLAPLFAPGTALAHRGQVEGEEGWVLGVD